MKQLILVITLIISSAVGAGESAWPEGSAMWMGAQLIEERDRYQRLSSALLEQIESHLEGQREREALRSHARAFDLYREAACEISGVATGAGGSWPSTYAVRCERGLAWDRYWSMKNALNCIRRVERNPYSSSADKLHCLIQTLNVKLY